MVVQRWCMNGWIDCHKVRYGVLEVGVCRSAPTRNPRVTRSGFSRVYPHPNPRIFTSGCGFGFFVIALLLAPTTPVLDSSLSTLPDVGYGTFPGHAPLELSQVLSPGLDSNGKRWIWAHCMFRHLSMYLCSSRSSRSKKVLLSSLNVWGLVMQLLCSAFKSSDV